MNRPGNFVNLAWVNRAPLWVSGLAHLVDVTGDARDQARDLSLVLLLEGIRHHGKLHLVCLRRACLP